MTEQNAGSTTAIAAEGEGSTTTPPATSTAAPTTATSGEGELGEAGKKAIQAEREARKNAEKELADVRAKVKEFEDRDKTETQRITEERDALKAKADRLEVENLRRDVAIAKGIPLEAAGRLVGTTRDELEADADALATVLKGAKPAFGNVTATSTSTVAGRTYKQSELNDHKFFTDNRADILLAIKEGRIITD